VTQHVVTAAAQKCDTFQAENNNQSQNQYKQGVKQRKIIILNAAIIIPLIILVAAVSGGVGWYFGSVTDIFSGW